MPPQKLYSFKAFGFEFELPLYAIYALAIIVVVGVGYSVYRYVYLQPEKVIISLQDVNKQLSAEVEEYSLHAMEEPEKHELFEDADGKLVLRVYKDHCVMIQRQTARGVRTKLVVDLARQGLLSAARQVMAPTTRNFLVETLFAQTGCSRGCINPHPGNFRWWYGQQRGAWVEVWRQWPEGCTHVQMFNPQVGMWDTNSDGTPRVRWTCCVH